MTRDSSLKPWWRELSVWLLMSGPIVAVVAGVITTIIAFALPDPLVASDARRSATDLARAQAASAAALEPAQKARNHSATGGLAK
ncbi:MAG: nitrogen fixation protein FixH [Burkholderiaceae bacterium]